MFEKTQIKITSSFYNVGSLNSSIKSQGMARDLSIRIDKFKSILAQKGQSRYARSKFIYSNSPKNIFNRPIFVNTEVGRNNEKDDTNNSNLFKYSKKKINKISNELKTLELPVFNNFIETKSFSNETENKEKADISITISKENKSISTEFISVNSINNTPAKKDQGLHFKNFSNSLNYPNRHSSKSSFVKSKFTDKINNNFNNCPDEILFQHNSLDLFDTKHYSPTKIECNQNTMNNYSEAPLNNNQALFNNITSNNDINLTFIENDVESDFDEIIEIFEDFNSNELKNDVKKNTEQDDNKLEIVDFTKRVIIKM